MRDARRLAIGLNATLVALLVVLIGVVAAELAHRHRWQLDLSEDGRTVLDPDTLAALALLEERDATVEITAFGAQAKDREAVLRDRMMRDFLAVLSAASPRVRTRLVDFDRDRLTAERLGVDRYGTVVVEGGGDRVDVIDRSLFRARGPKGEREVQFVGEAPIAAAIRQVVSDRVRLVVALTGHGEDEVYDRGLGELRSLASRIDEQGLEVRTVDLLKEAAPGSPPAIPADAAAVLILGARAPLAGVEVEALRDWLGRGGSVGWLLDPRDPAPELLGELGVSLPDGVALDPKSYFPHVERPILGYGRHEITESLLEDDVPTVVSLARPVEIAPVDGVSASPLLQTSRQGWIERGTEQPPVYDAATDGAGPVVVGAALTVRAPHPWVRTEQEARVVVIGDVDLVRDELLAESPGNATLVTNVLRWLVRTDQAFARVGRPTRIRRLALGASQLSVLRLVLMAGMPLLAAGVGTAVLAARRDR